MLRRGVRQGYNMATSTISALTAASGNDPVNDYLAIDVANISTTQKINRNTLLGLGSAPVGLTDTQTLTNKTLTSPTVSNPTYSGTLSGTYTIGGTPTFPSGITQNTATQTLTNKTLTSPTINSPTITNATISADTLSGYTTSNAGTVYGISVSGGQITNAAIANGTIGSTQIATNGVAASNLATNAITLGYASVTTAQTINSTSITNVTGLSVTVTVPAGGRRVRITGVVHLISGGGTGLAKANINESSTVLQTSQIWIAATSGAFTNMCVTTVVPSAGSHTYFLSVGLPSTTSQTYADAVGFLAYILVEAI